MAFANYFHWMNSTTNSSRLPLYAANQNVINHIHKML
uniref:Uncharacterized protein n=1 Tax=Anguilla anguilla TaxID=7936 RepID=A0A0E9RI58_ANGAN